MRVRASKIDSESRAKRWEGKHQEAEDAALKRLDGEIRDRARQEKGEKFLDTHPKKKKSNLRAILAREGLLK